MISLWEASHSYHAAEGNYYSNDCHHKYLTFGDFYSYMNDSDMDYNLLYRWDWRKPRNGSLGVLTTYWVGQRKAQLWSQECPIHPDEEELLKEFLQKRLDHLIKLWHPLVPNLTDPVLKKLEDDDD